MSLPEDTKSVLFLNSYASWRRLVFFFDRTRSVDLTMASTGQFPDLQSVIALVKTLTNAQLKDILRSEALAVSGVKASLQLRIIDCL